MQGKVAGSVAVDSEAGFVAWRLGWCIQTETLYLIATKAPRVIMAVASVPTIVD